MAEKSELIRRDIEQTRAEMGDTLDALSYKANVPARTKGWAARKKDAVVGGRDRLWRSCRAQPTR